MKKTTKSAMPRAGDARGPDGERAAAGQSSKPQRGDVLHIGDLVPDPKNARRRTPRSSGMIVDSLHEVGAARSIVIDEGGVILAGNGLVEAAGEAGITKVRVIEADGNEIIAVRRTGLTKRQKTRLALFDNRTSDLSEFVPEVLAELEPADLESMFFPEELADIFGIPREEKKGDPASLVERFGVPPFSVLDARQGYWQDRKRAWLALGIESELGRGAQLIPNGGATPRRNGTAPGGSPRPAAKLGADGKTRRGDGRGREIQR